MVNKLKAVVKYVCSIDIYQQYLLLDYLIDLEESIISIKKEIIKDHVDHEEAVSSIHSATAIWNFWTTIFEIRNMINNDFDSVSIGQWNDLYNQQLDNTAKAVLSALVHESQVLPLNANMVITLAGDPDPELYFVARNLKFIPIPQSLTLLESELPTVDIPEPTTVISDKRILVGNAFLETIDYLEYSDELDSYQALIYAGLVGQPPTIHELVTEGLSKFTALTNAVQTKNSSEISAFIGGVFKGTPSEYNQYTLTVNLNDSVSVDYYHPLGDIPALLEIYLDFKIKNKASSIYCSQDNEL